MRILTLEEMAAVSGGGRLDSADHDGSSGRTGSSSSKSGGGNRTSDGHAQNSGWGGTIGGLIGGFLGARAAGGFGPAAAAGHALGKIAGSAWGNVVENGYVAGANKAIDKSVHDANQAMGMARAGSRFGGSH